MNIRDFILPGETFCRKVAGEVSAALDEHAGRWGLDNLRVLTVSPLTVSPADELFPLRPGVFASEQSQCFLLGNILGLEPAHEEVTSSLFFRSLLADAIMQLCGLDARDGETGGWPEPDVIGAGYLGICMGDESASGPQVELIVHARLFGGATPQPADPLAAVSLEPLLDGARVMLEATLEEVSLGLSQVLSLSVGDVLMMGPGAIDRVKVRGADGMPPLRGYLGAAKGALAVKLERSGDES